ncbi:MAG: glucose-1-phosphate adenylyltransferase [Deltaproteobacteria bacterium]|nr:glucose-1-phosphate adenylyltransferase [Deltaproteobacteria bacterium]
MSEDMKRTLSIVLAGGEGRRLYPLTMTRAKPAVPFAGRYRLIDFVLSNLVNSGFLWIKVITQYKADSLIQHIFRTWRLSNVLDHYIDVVPAQMRVTKEWFKGSADAIFQNIDIIEADRPEHILVFGADHIYRMDISQMFRYHLEKDADLTISTTTFPENEYKRYGILSTDENGRVIHYVEKPVSKDMIYFSNPVASMGNFIFKKEVLINAVIEDSHDDKSTHDLSRDIIPKLVKTHKVYAYDFNTNTVPGMDESERGYFRDVGTIDGYFNTSMEMVDVSPPFSLYNAQWPIKAISLNMPPAKFVFADFNSGRAGYALDSLISEGCIISGSVVKRSILSPCVRVNSYSEISESVIFDSVVIGRHCKIRRTIIDKEVYIPEKTVIGYNIDEDRKRFYVSENGVVVVPRGYRF